MDRFHYTIKQKLQLINLTETGQLVRTQEQFPKVTQKQLEEWKDKEEEMKAVSPNVQNSKYTLHKGPKRKYAELYQYLYQVVKEMRLSRQPVTIDLLVQIAQAECDEVKNLTNKGQISLVRRFMDLFRLSVREVTGTSGFREEQADSVQLEERDKFLRDFKRLIVEKSIPIESVFNMDQTGVFYENPPSRTVDFMGNREIPVLTQKGEKKRLTLFSTINAAGSLFKQLIVLKGTPNARIHSEVRGYDDENTIHTCQENAWCSNDVLEEWHRKIWTPIAQAIPGPKLLLVDSYPLHVDALPLLSDHQTTVLLIPSGLTFNLQPLDSGFFKLLKDELRKVWIRDWATNTPSERERRETISAQLREIWHTMNEKDLTIFWQKASLVYPRWDVEFEQRRRFQQMFEDSSFYESRDNTQMAIEQDHNQVAIGQDDTQMTIEQDYQDQQEQSQDILNMLQSQNIEQQSQNILNMLQSQNVEQQSQDILTCQNIEQQSQNILNMLQSQNTDQQSQDMLNMLQSQNTDQRSQNILNMQQSQKTVSEDI